MSARLAGTLLEPSGGTAVRGDLEDTALLASFDTFRLFGQASPPDLRPDPRDNEGKQLLPPPEWAEIKNRALDALRRTKDLRLLAHLGTASLWTDGLPPFAETLAIASQWLETYWAETYPLVDEDAILRRNALNCFADPTAVIDWLGRLPLVASRRWNICPAGVAARRCGRPAGCHATRRNEVDDLGGEQSVVDALAALKNTSAAMAPWRRRGGSGIRLLCHTRANACAERQRQARRRGRYAPSQRPILR